MWPQGTNRPLELANRGIGRILSPVPLPSSTASRACWDKGAGTGGRDRFAEGNLRGPHGGDLGAGSAGADFVSSTLGEPAGTAQPLRDEPGGMPFAKRMAQLGQQYPGPGSGQIGRAHVLT